MNKKLFNTILPFCLGLFLGALLSGSAMAAVKQPELQQLDEIEFKDARIQDAIRVISELSAINIVATQLAGKKKFTLYLRNLPIKNAIDSIARVAGLWYRQNPDTGVYVMMTTEEYFKDIVIYRQEATRVFTLRYQNVVKIARTIEAMFGEERVRLDLQMDFADDLVVPGAELDDLTGSDSGSGSNRGRNRGRNDNRRSFSGRTGRGGARYDERTVKEEIGGMTTEQIAILEKFKTLAGEAPLLLSEKTLAGVRRTSSVPIFVSVNREHNLLFIRTADEKALAQVEDIVRESDRPTPQVLLEMKVMSVQLDDGFKSAFDFSFTSSTRSSGPDDGQPPNPLEPDVEGTALIDPDTGDVLGVIDDVIGPKGVLGLGNASLMDSSTMVFQLMNDHVRARLQLLENEGRINIMATPMLLASNSRAAKIFIGDQTVVTTGFDTDFANAGGGGNNTFRATPVPETMVMDIGNTLTILPSINGDRTVLLRLKQESSSLNINGGRIPLPIGGRLVQVPIDTIDKAVMEGTAMAKDGMTVVIGGMITESTSDTEERVPWLGDIPGLGVLFRDTSRTSKKQELVLLITPHVFTTPEEAEAISRQRLAELQQHPNAIDVYLNRLDENRKGTVAGRAANAGIDKVLPTTTVAGRQLDKHYANLAGYAAQAVRQPYGQSNPRLDPVRVRFKDSILLSADPNIDARVSKSWRNGQIYVTALKITNKDSVERVVDERVVKGNWLWKTIEENKLAPGQSTWMYVVSDERFVDAVFPAPVAASNNTEVPKPMAEVPRPYSFSDDDPLQDFH